jgi:hypothetical protein
MTIMQWNKQVAVFICETRDAMKLTDLQNLFYKVRVIY